MNCRYLILITPLGKNYAFDYYLGRVLLSPVLKGYTSPPTLPPNKLLQERLFLEKTCYLRLCFFLDCKLIFNRLLCE